MLAWMIILTVVCAALVIGYYCTIKVLKKYQEKTDKLLRYDLYRHAQSLNRSANAGYDYTYIRKDGNDPYDDRPTFIKSVNELVANVNRIERYGNFQSNERLTARVDNLDEDVEQLRCDIENLDGYIRKIDKREDETNA